MDTAFSFDQKQRNTLKVSGLAAYVQRPPRDRVGWVHAEEVWLPNWRPKKWVWHVRHVEVTFDSYTTVEEMEGKDWDFRAWEHWMVTARETFVTDHIQEVEACFAQYVDRAEFAQHPDKVRFPNEFKSHKRQHDTDLVDWNFSRRALVAALLQAQTNGEQITWDTADLRLTGRVHALELHGFQILVGVSVLQLWFGDVDDVRLSIMHDGYNKQYRFTGINHDPAALPFWIEAEGKWVMPSEEDA